MTTLTQIYWVQHWFLLVVTVQRNECHSPWNPIKKSGAILHGKTWITYIITLLEFKCWTDRSNQCRQCSVTAIDWCLVFVCSCFECGSRSIGLPWLVHESYDARLLDYRYSMNLSRIIGLRDSGIMSHGLSIGRMPPAPSNSRRGLLLMQRL